MTESNTLLEQTQEIHYQLDALNGLFAAVQEKVLQEPFNKYSEFAEEMFTKAKEALEKEAVRLDGLLQQSLLDSVSEPTEPNNYKQYADLLTVLLTTPADGFDFMDAVKTNSVSLVQLLLQPIDGHPDPSTSNNHAIRYACENGHTEIVRMLLQDPRVDPSDSDNKAICIASANGHTEIVRQLLQDPRVDPTAWHNEAFQSACGNGHTEVVRILLQWSSGTKRVDPSNYSNQALRKASMEGYTEIVRLLINDPRVDASSNSNFAFYTAIRNSQTDLVRLLLDWTSADGGRRVDPTIDDNWPIRYASIIGRAGIVRVLLEDDRIDPTSNNHETIRRTLKKGHKDVMRLLLAWYLKHPQARDEIPAFIRECELWVDEK
jgi:ankyrin repeat protein